MNCSHRLYPLEPNAPNPFVHLDAPLAVGDVALFRLAVNCVAQDATLALEKHGNATDPTVDHLGVGSEVELAVQYGVPPTIEDGGYIDGVVSFSDEPDAILRIGNVLPGVYYAAVHVSAGEPLARFTLRLTLEGSRVPNPWNRCEHADEQLLMDVTVAGADPGAEGAGTYAYTRLGPVTGADGYPTALGVADVYEPAYGHCGTLDEETPQSEDRAFTLVRTSEEEACCSRRRVPTTVPRVPTATATRGSAVVLPRRFALVGSGAGPAAGARAGRRRRGGGPRQEPPGANRRGLLLPPGRREEVPGAVLSVNASPPRRPLRV